MTKTTRARAAPGACPKREHRNGEDVSLRDALPWSCAGDGAQTVNLL